MTVLCIVIFCVLRVLFICFFCSSLSLLLSDDLGIKLSLSQSFVVCLFFSPITCYMSRLLSFLRALLTLRIRHVGGTKSEMGMGIRRWKEMSKRKYAQLFKHVYRFLIGYDNKPE